MKSCPQLAEIPGLALLSRNRPQNVLKKHIGISVSTVPKSIPCALWGKAKLSNQHHQWSNKCQLASAGYPHHVSGSVAEKTLKSNKAGNAGAISCGSTQKQETRVSYSILASDQPQRKAHWQTSWCERHWCVFGT